MTNEEAEMALAQLEAARRYEEEGAERARAERTVTVTIPGDVLVDAEAVFIDPYFLGDVATSISCGEVDRIAALLRACNLPYAAERLIHAHSEEDDEGDEHYHYPDPDEDGECYPEPKLDWLEQA